jgi:hypothetical protein
MNYVQELKAEHKKIFWCDASKIRAQNDNWWAFHLNKEATVFNDIEDKTSFDLIYFDAFGYRVQPELWSTTIFKKCMTH